MERTPKKGEPIVTENFQENHIGIPGQKEPIDVVVTTLRGEDGSISEVKTERKSGHVPSILTVYGYEKVSLAFIENSLFSPEFSWHRTVELFNAKNKENTYLFHPGDILREPRAGEIIDFSSVIQKAKELAHPSLKIIEGEGRNTVIATTTYTDEKHAVHPLCKVWEFDVLDGKNILRRTTNVQSLKGVGDNSWHPNALPEIKEFLYDEKGLKGVNVYKGDELYYSDSYGLWWAGDILVNGEPAQVFDVTRTFGEHNREQTDEDERYYSFGDLLTKDWPTQLYASAFGARVSDSLPLFVRQPGEENIWALNRQIGDIFTREIQFPTIPDKKIKVRLEVIGINKAGQPQYRELGLEVV